MSAGRQPPPERSGHAVPEVRPGHARPSLLDSLRATLAMPDLSPQERESFRGRHADSRDPLVVPVVVMAVVLIASFVGWDVLREGHFDEVARVRLGGSAAVLALLAVVRRTLEGWFRVQTLVLYVAVYGLQLAVAWALHDHAPLQLPGLLMTMFFSVLALSRASDVLINVPLAVPSVLLVLPHDPTAADILYVTAHLATVVLLTWLASSLLERLAAQGFAYSRRLQHEAATDALTGLGNRRAFERGIGLEIERANRLGLPLVLALIDIDHFKHINDTHGHDVGDRVLQVVSGSLQDGIRHTDQLSRIGGEEFALVMLGTGLPGAHAMLERLREAVASLHLPVGEQSIRCTVSLGLTLHAAGDLGWPDLYKRADRALYEAKEGGRDRVVEAAPAAGRVPA